MVLFLQMKLRSSTLRYGITSESEFLIEKNGQYTSFCNNIPTMVAVPPFACLLFINKITTILE
jgi:hypothetical protein